MKFYFIAAMALTILYSCNRKMISASYNNQTYLDSRGNPMLLGTHARKDLQQTPYNDWYNKNYADYRPDSASTSQLQALIKNKHFEIFMGTWCGDSKREVPRMFKVLQQAGVKDNQVKLVMVDSRVSAYKQSPAHEEKGKHIHRVPCLIVYEGNKELNRIVEYPVVSIEKDLCCILNASTYQPNYKAAAYLIDLSEKQDATGIMRNLETISSTLKTLVSHSAELNSLGYMWMAANENDKALMAFSINAILFPSDANIYNSLGEINMKLGKTEEAKKYYQKASELSKVKE